MQNRLIMRYFFLTLPFLIIACRQDKEQATIPDEKMAKIISEIAIADAGTTMLNSFKKDSLANAYYRQVFEMNGVTLEEYEKNLRIVVSDIPRIELIVKKAEEIIAQKKDSLPVLPDKKTKE